MTSARSEILARVRRAVADHPVDVPRAGSRALSAPFAGSRTEQLAQRVADYGAGVTICHEREAADAVAAICGRHSVRSLVVADGLPDAWSPAGVRVRRDAPPLSVAELSSVDGVLTGAAAAVAESGTIVLDAGERSGRRALTLVPDLHVCVIRAREIVGTIAEGIATVGSAIVAGRPITFVSGPSATSDIELRRVEGVHGPRRLEVVVTRERA